MKTNRLEAFSDGVLAIVITIMVLELEAPKDTSLEALIPKIPIFISYILSFIYVGIYWNNHHHLFQIAKKVNGKILWANLHLLFWLSLIPFVTSWLGEHHLEPVPLLFYGFTLLMCGVAYNILQVVIIKEHKKDFALRNILGKKYKEKVSLLIYIIGLVVAYYAPWPAVACYIIVALIWLIPNKRIEKIVK